MPGVELALTVLHAGGKFDKNTYKVSGRPARGGRLGGQRPLRTAGGGGRPRRQPAPDGVRRGHTVKKLEILGKARGTGTTVRFEPDPEIFTGSSSTTTPWPTGCASWRSSIEASASTSRMEREDPAKTETFYAKGGLVQFVEWLNRNKKVLHPKPVSFTVTKDDVEVDLALQYEDGYNENTFTLSTTSIPTRVART